MESIDERLEGRTSINAQAQEDKGCEATLKHSCSTWVSRGIDISIGCQQCNHLLLKGAWVPEAQAGYLACFDALARAYLAGVNWESADALEARAASLLPGLLLARVDGKSPVEYLQHEAQKARVRQVARGLLGSPAQHLSAIRERWQGS